MEVDKLADMVAIMMADREVDMVADMEPPLWRWTKWPTWSSARVTRLELPKGAKDEVKPARRAAS